jgi:ABC-type Zn2+ transport system substrate-binding protein/surface adhesin
MPFKSYSPWFDDDDNDDDNNKNNDDDDDADYDNNIWLEDQVTKLLHMQVSSTFCYVFPLRFKYSPQNPDLRGKKISFNLFM